MAPKISVIIPTYNEAGNVVALVDRLDAALTDYDWEVVFVDDNSPDGTADLVHKLSQANARVRLVLRIHDRGLAKAGIQGLLSGKGDILCVMDGDGQHDAETLRKLLDPIIAGAADIVSAARRLDATGDNSLSQTRVSLSRLGNRLSSAVLGRSVTDPLTGFFAISRPAFLSVAPSLRDPGFKLLLDILSSNHRLRHQEIPFDFGERLSGESKLGSLVMWQFATFLASKMTGGILPASLISFLVVGGSGVFVHLAVLYAALGATGDFAVSQLLGALTAVTTNFLLNNWLTFRDRRLRGSTLVYGYLKFLIISSVGIAANVSIATFTYEKLGYVALLASLCGIALDTIWKYVVSSRIVWRRK